MSTERELLLREIEVLSNVSQLKVALPKYQDVRNVEKGKMPQIVSAFEITLFYQNQEFLKAIEDKIVSLMEQVYPELMEPFLPKELEKAVNEAIESKPLEVVK